MMKDEFKPKAIAKTIDVEELYDLDITIARFILPRLMVFKKHCERTPNLNMTREEWNDQAIVYGYSREARPKNMLYSFGEHGRDQIDFYQGGAFNVSYTLSGELERGKLP